MLTDEQAEEILQEIENMPDQDFNRMCDYFAEQSRTRIFARLKNGTASDNEVLWLFENRGPCNFPAA